MTPDKKLEIINGWVDTFSIAPRGGGYIGKIMMNRISIYFQYTMIYNNRNNALDDSYCRVRDDVWEYVYRWVK